jgi:hypothetical protein
VCGRKSLRNLIFAGQKNSLGRKILNHENLFCHLAEVNSAMATLAKAAGIPVETVTLFDLSDFTEF